MEGQFYKPRMDRELLERYHKGILATTGCPSGEVQTLLRLGKYDEALAVGRLLPRPVRRRQLLRRADGPRARHRAPGARRPAAARQGPRPAAGRHQRPALHQREDAVGHEALLCVQSGSTMNDANRFKLDGDGYYLKTPRRCATSSASCPRPATTRLLIAERCEVEFTEGRNLMPRFPVPEGETEETLFVKAGRGRPAPPLPATGISRAGARARRPRDVDDPADGLPGLLPGHRRPDQLGQVARASGSGPGAGRRPARSSRTRWASPSSTRSSTACSSSGSSTPSGSRCPTSTSTSTSAAAARCSATSPRSTARTGSSQVVTYGTIKAKQALKDASRVLGYPFAMGERITKAMPPSVMGKDIPLAAVFDREPQAVRRGDRAARPLRERPRRPEDRRHRAPAGEPEAPVGRARLRGDHVQRAADRRTSR